MRRLTVIVALALLVVACQPGEKKAVTIETPFVGGTQGLTIDFQDFRSEVFDGGGDPFDVIVRLDNKGETLVPQNNLRVRLSGINPAEFNLGEADMIKFAPDDAIEVRKDPQGNVLAPPPVFVEFTGFNHVSPIAGSTAQFPLRADVCYLYRTRAVSKVCVRENLLVPEPDGICEITEDKPVFNSGAPVQIRNFRESTRAKDKVGFTFDIVNAGTGNIFERNTLCDRTQRKNENRVYVIIDTGLNGLSCTGLESTGKGAEGFVTLYGGSKIISCSQTITSRADFEQLVNVEVIYDYEEITQTTLTVKSSGEEFDV